MNSERKNSGKRNSKIWKYISELKGDCKQIKHLLTMIRKGKKNPENKKWHYKMKRYKKGKKTKNWKQVV